jgi:hypothetical protein
MPRFALRLDIGGRLTRGNMQAVAILQAAHQLIMMDLPCKHCQFPRNI